MTFVFKSLQVNVTYFPAPEAWRCRFRTPAMVGWETFLPPFPDDEPVTSLTGARFYDMFLLSANAAMFQRGSEFHSWLSVLLSEALQAIPFLLTMCRPLALLALVIGATHDIVQGEKGCHDFPAVCPGMHYRELRAQVLGHLGIPQLAYKPSAFANSWKQVENILGNSTATLNVYIVRVFLEYESLLMKRLPSKCRLEKSNSHVVDCADQWKDIIDESHRVEKKHHICIQGITGIARAPKEFFHFMRGHFFETLVLLEENRLLQNDTRPVVLSFGDPTHMCPISSLLGFYSLITQEPGVHKARGNVHFDNDCEQTSSREGAIVLKFPSMEVVDTENLMFDWEAFLRSSRRVPTIARSLALQWLGAADIPVIRKGPIQVMLLSRRSGRDFLNRDEIFKYLSETCEPVAGSAYCELKAFRFEEIPWHEQMKVMARTRVLVAFHGAAAGVHEVWMPRGSVVIEFQPHDVWYCTIAYCMTADPGRDMLYVMSTTAGTDEAFPAVEGSPLPDGLRHVGPSDIAFHNTHNHRRIVGLEALTLLRFAMQKLRSEKNSSIAVLFRRSAKEARHSRVVPGACFGTALQVYERSFA